MSTLRLALKNLWRTPRRTVLTVVTIIAGVGISIVGRGFIDGIEEGIIVGAVDGTVGHVQARPADYPTQHGQHPVDALLTLSPEARALLDAEPSAWTQRTYFSPTAANGRDSLRVVGIIYDPKRDAQVFPHDGWKVEGALPTPGTREVALTPRIAGLLKVEPGGSLILQVRSHPGAMNALEVKVSGIVRTGNPAIDSRGLLAPDSLGQELLATDLSSHLSVKLPRRADSTAFARKLAAALGAGAEVVTWQTETAEMIELQKVRRSALNMVVFVLMTLAAFGIANTVLMAAHERVREVGTLRSMGMTEGGVTRLFLVEGALMGLLGGLLGAGLGGALVRHWAQHPIDFSKVYEAQRMSFSVSSLVYTQLEPRSLLLGVLLAVVIAALASIYPARFASRMVPADAVRAS